MKQGFRMNNISNVSNFSLCADTTNLHHSIEREKLYMTVECLHRRTSDSIFHALSNDVVFTVYAPNQKFDPVDINNTQGRIDTTFYA